VFNKLSLGRKDALIFLLLTLIALGALVAFYQFQKPVLTIRWTTESEIDVLGFNLLRSDSADGEYVRVNSALIPPARDPFVGGEYLFKDTTVDRGVRYYYKLETVYRDGHTTLSEPIMVPSGR
jgi:hypothetical protein